MGEPAIQVKTLKLMSGEELISEVLNLSDPSRWYMLEYPLRVEHYFDQHGEDCFDLIPYLFSSNDYHLNLKTSAVTCLANPNPVMLRRYRKVVEAMANSAEAMESLNRRGKTSK